MRTRNLKYYSLLALLFVVANTYAQQVPLYSQYYFNKFMYNPAMAGHSGKTEANIFGRNQYTAIDGYQTAGASISGQVNEGKVGLGLYLVNDANLLMTQNSVYGNYAYNFKLSDENILSFGFSLGIVNNRFNTENIIATDPNDDVLRLLNTRPGAMFDASLGMNLNLSGFQLGVAAPQFLAENQDFTDNQNGSVLFDLQNHLIAMASYDIEVSKNMIIQPLVMYKNVKNAPGQFDINLIADWKNNGWLGAAYRDGYGVTAMGGIRIAEKMRFGYSYDWSIGDYSQALGGSHEVLLGITLGKPKKVDNPNKEDMDRLKQELTDKADEDLQMQQEKIAELEKKLDEVEMQKREKDTVYIVQKVEVATPAEPRVETPRRETPRTTPTPTPTPTRTTPTTTDVAPGQFIAVAGSFTAEENAQKFFNSLVNKGLSPYIYYDKSNQHYYVHLGKFYVKDEARKFAKESANNGVSVWVKTIQ